MDRRPAAGVAALLIALVLPACSGSTSDATGEDGGTPTGASCTDYPLCPGVDLYAECSSCIGDACNQQNEEPDADRVRCMLEALRDREHGSVMVTFGDQTCGESHTITIIDYNTVWVETYSFDDLGNGEESSFSAGLRPEAEYQACLDAELADAVRCLRLPYDKTVTPSCACDFCTQQEEEYDDF